MVNDGGQKLAATTLTLPELSRRAGVSESTARRYVKQFSEFVPAESRGRLRTYSEEAIAVLQRIKALYDLGFGTEEVRQKLESEFQRTIDVEPVAEEGGEQSPEPATGSASLEAQGIVREFVRYIRRDDQRGRQIQLLKKGLQALRDKMQQLEHRQKSLPKSEPKPDPRIDALERRLEELEKRVLDLEAREDKHRSFWGRFRRNK